MNLNNKIANLLKEHKEGGEKFFNALDDMIRRDSSILNIFINFAINELLSIYDNNYIKERTLILSGNFGNAIINNYNKILLSFFDDIIIVDGGIRKTGKVELYKNSLFINDFIFFDDSYYSGATKNTIETALQEINPSARIIETFVVYDGSKRRIRKLHSLFRYYEKD